MDHILELVNLYGDKAVAVLGYLGGLGVVDAILRKVPTQKPKSILLGVKAVLHFVAVVAAKLDAVIDAIPFMKQEIKEEKKPE